MNKELSYKIALKRCVEAGVEPAFCYSDYIGIMHGSSYVMYKVKCLKCGRVYETHLRENGVKKCTCDYNSPYNRAKRNVERSGYDLVEDETSFKDLTIPHLVRCKRCGKIENRRVDGAELKCNCKSYFSAKECCLRWGLELMETLESYKGRKHKMKVKCKKCGNEYETYVLESGVAKCVGCKINSSYERALEKCKLSKLEPLFSKDDYHGDFINGKTIYYKVKCLRCKTVYRTQFGTNENTNLCPKCKKSLFRSHREQILSIEFSKYNHYKNYRSKDFIFDGKRSLEVDLFFYDKNIAFELNGYYWHSTRFHDKDYHRLKTSLAKEKGVLLYHLWEDIEMSKLIKFIESKLKKLKDPGELILFDYSKEFVNSNSLLSVGNFSGSISVGDKRVLGSLLYREQNNFVKVIRIVTHLSYKPERILEKLLNEFCVRFINKKKIIYIDRDYEPEISSVYSKFGFVVESDEVYRRLYVVKDIDLYDTVIKRGKYRVNSSEILTALELTDMDLESFIDKYNLLEVWNSGLTKLVKYD